MNTSSIHTLHIGAIHISINVSANASVTISYDQEAVSDPIAYYERKEYNL